MNVIIVEDQALVREIVRKVCEREFGLRVVGETGSAIEALQLLRSNPDLMILDLKLADGDGFSVIAAARPLHPQLRILVLSGYCNAYTVYRSERAQVDGFVDKNANPLLGLRQAIATIRCGGHYYSERFRTIRMQLASNPSVFPDRLSDQDQDVLTSIALGEQNGTIVPRQESPRARTDVLRGGLRPAGMPAAPKLTVRADSLDFGGRSVL